MAEYANDVQRLVGSGSYIWLLAAFDIAFLENLMRQGWSG
jgi:hypothetical protein